MGRDNLSQVVGLVRRGSAPKWCSVGCGVFRSVESLGVLLPGWGVFDLHYSGVSCVSFPGSSAC
jgi:hypothetical protein